MSLDLKPSHASVKAYYDTLHQFGQLYIDHEGAVRSAFQDLLAKCGRKAKPPLTLVPEYRIERARSSVIVDGALVDLYHLPHGYWEAKDEKDDLAREVERKLDKGYPRDNIIFQAPERAILYQSGARIFDENITRPEALVSVVNQFFDYKAPHIQEWKKLSVISPSAFLNSPPPLARLLTRRRNAIRLSSAASKISTHSASRLSIPTCPRKRSSACWCSICSPSVSSAKTSIIRISPAATWLPPKLKK